MGGWGGWWRLRCATRRDVSTWGGAGDGTGGGTGGGDRPPLILRLRRTVFLQSLERLPNFDPLATFDLLATLDLLETFNLLKTFVLDLLPIFGERLRLEPLLIYLP